MESPNLIKSDAGWRRFQERTNGGERAYRARMDHRVKRAGKAAQARSMQISQLEPNELEPELNDEIGAISWCADCDGPCTCE